MEWAAITTLVFIGLAYYVGYDAGRRSVFYEQRRAAEEKEWERERAADAK